MKVSEIQAMSIAEIEEKIAELEASYRRLKFKHTIANLENPMEIRKTRRTIARLNTILNQKAAEEAAA